MVVNVSSYILNAQEKGAQEISPKDAAPRLLKAIADMVLSGDRKKESCSNDELLSVTGLPVPVAMEALKLLLASGMIEQVGNSYKLTPTGERTHLLVAR